MEILLVASEAVPFAKTGGLADVAGTLPRFLEAIGLTVRLIIPCHRSAWSAGVPLAATGITLRIPIGSIWVEGYVQRSNLPGSGVEVFLIDCPAYFDRSGIYQERGLDYTDNAARFLFFTRGVFETIGELGWRLDVLHGNDWPCGMLPVYLEELYRRRPGFSTIGTLLTIHNLAYQGSFWPGDMALTGLDARLLNWRQLEAYGRLNFLKAGLVYSDLISTVSPTYAREIQEPAHGWGLDGLIRSRAADLRAVLNGIDPAEWNPARDARLPARYDAATFPAGKAACKHELQRRAGLPARSDVPLLAQIGRLDPQKGWDLLAVVADDLLRSDVQLVVLGEGPPRYRELLDRLASRYPGKFHAFLEFSDDLAHQIEGAADLILMPSLYEPCGLNQLYSLAYGTVPVVRATGGLADTVVDATPAALAEGTATGFVFHEPTPSAFRATIDRALALWRDRPAWERLIESEMRMDWTWERSASGYAKLYEEVRHRRAACAVG